MNEFSENGLLPSADEHFVWPAIRDGVPEVPPLSHVLDALVRYRVGGREDIEMELMTHIHAGTVAIVTSLPRCDFCDAPARYDAQVRSANGAWANLCAHHFVERTSGMLGVGEGQYLFIESELPAGVWVALERALEYWNHWSPPPL